MKVKSANTSGSPLPIEAATPNIKDGTSNTLGAVESSKPQMPFAKDTFENSKFEPIGVLAGNASGNLAKGILDGSSKDGAYGTVAGGIKQVDHPASGSGQKVVDSINVKYT